jgi:hypothetical protein
MKPVLFVLFGLTVVITVVGLLTAFARPIKWPANVTAPDWRRAFGDKVEHVAEQVIEEAGA